MSIHELTRPLAPKALMDDDFLSTKRGKTRHVEARIKRCTTQHSTVQFSSRPCPSPEQVDGVVLSWVRVMKQALRRTYSTSI